MAPSGCHESLPRSGLVQSAVCSAPHTAEFERELIRARTGDGIKRAKAAGVHMGRSSKLTKHQQREVLARLKRGDETLVEIARSYDVSHMTIARLRERHAAL